ncbi:MAG: bifunctional phosphoribosyl-AMP cyclohydrolase/phosphoribosyl-ATP diphosphatase HisIE [Thermoanaerobaculia bacterium]|nr:bifunctional phosphoribosyl-AMP cyclohydrolase/phosphoribosyl-ATP diphosphatase HisIE [Thermoanaerobaculia bacterium]
MIDPAELKYDDRGLLPVVVQDVATGAVLMVAWANAEAVRRTLESADGWFWSRSRQELWRKGATSGHVLRVQEVAADCDGDTLLYRVHPAGPACHLGTRTCFDSESPEPDSRNGFENPARLELGWLAEILDARRAAATPESSYTARLLAAGTPRIAQKVAEEAAEAAIGAVVHSQDETAEARSELVGEAADLLYHLSVLLLDRGIDLRDVAERLAERHRSRLPESEQRS